MQYFIFGPSGSGKTTEVYSQFILPALQAGRRVVSNVPIQPKVVEEFLGAPPNYVFLETEKYQDPLSWPVVVSGEVQAGKVFRPGDLIIIDECHDIFHNRKPLSPRILSSISMQRHFSNAEGQGIDIVWVSQTKRKFHSDIRDNGEAYYKVFPRSELDRKDEHKLSIYSSWECRKDDMGAAPRVIPHDKSLYSHYRSVAEGIAGRKILDNRIKSLGLKHYLLIALIPISFIMVGFALYYANSLLRAKPKNKSSSHSGVSASAIQPVKPGPRLVINGSRYCISTGSDGISRVISEPLAAAGQQSDQAGDRCDRPRDDGNRPFVDLGGTSR